MSGGDHGALLVVARWLLDADDVERMVLPTLADAAHEDGPRPGIAARARLAGRGSRGASAR